jgi:hypothetical protein
LACCIPLNEKALRHAPEELAFKEDVSTAEKTLYTLVELMTGET